MNLKQENLPEFLQVLCFVLHVVLVCVSSSFNCSRLSLASSKFKCLSLQLSAMKSVDWKLHFILLYMYIWFSMFYL